MNTMTQADIVASHPAIVRFGAALENLQALLQLMGRVARSMQRWSGWARLSDAVVIANQRRVEAIILRDPRISDEIRVALLRRDREER